MNLSKRYVIILAGGSGSRMGASIPKQMMEIGGKPILRHTIERFLNLPFEVEIIIVINKNIVNIWKEYCFKSEFFFKYKMVLGGITRFHSVKKGLKYVAPDGIVAVHDGVRPFIKQQAVVSMFEKVENLEALIPFVKVTDSLREIDQDGQTHPIDRDKILSIQTPQLFQSSILLKAYQQPYSPSFTDDASVVEQLGCKLSFYEGDKNNIKITTQEDLLVADYLL
jgi:2-C-methyl-D-erythritol 4-phosphate cytidylyltransferase